MKTLEIRIAANGSISVQTHGFQGNTCMEAIPLLQTLCGGHVLESAFTEAQTLHNSTQIKEVERCRI